MLFNSAKGFFQCKAFVGDNKTYYFSLLVDTANSANVGCAIGSDIPQYTKDLGNGWTLYASILKDDATYRYNRITEKRTSDWTAVQTKEWMKICLTDLYPDGVYPSVEECSSLFKYVSGING